jgi:hypothetical protein
MTEYYKKVSEIVRQRGGRVGVLQKWNIVNDKIVWWDASLGEKPTQEEIEAVQLPVETPEIFTSEQWVQKYFSSLEIIALTRLEQSILQQSKVLGPKMQACKEWLEAMMFAQPSIFFLPAPYTYTEASAEAAQTLST